MATLYYFNASAVPDAAAFLSADNWFTGHDEIEGMYGPASLPPEVGDTVNYVYLDEYDPVNEPGQFLHIANLVPDGVYGNLAVDLGVLGPYVNENGDTNIEEIEGGGTVQGDVSGLWYIDGVLGNGLDLNYVATPFFEGYLIEGSISVSPDPGSPVWDGSHFFLANGWVTDLPESGTGTETYATGSKFCVNGWVAEGNEDLSDAVNIDGAGVWDGYDIDQNISNPELAGTYLNGKLVIHHIAVSGDSDPLANGDYFEVPPDASYDRRFENSNGYYFQRSVVGPFGWEFYESTASVHSGWAEFASAVETPLKPDGITDWNDPSIAPTIVTHFTAGSSSDILLSGFPGSTTIFGAGLLAA